MKALMLIVLLCVATALRADDWPREFGSPEGTITMYQPQIGSYQGNSLSARAALAVSLPGSSEPVFGSVWLDCHVLSDRPSRTVRVLDAKVRQIRFPSDADAQTAKVKSDLEQQIPQWDLTFSMDELLESLESAQKERETAHELDTIPPRIIYADHPAVLVTLDGDPVLVDVEGTALRRVANTPFFIVQETSDGICYLHGGNIWYQSREVTGPWRQVANAPQDVVDLSVETAATDTADEAAPGSNTPGATGKVPEIIVTTEPAELIASDGPVQLSPIEGTELLYASNTQNDLFMDIASQEYYVLISGRWYRAKSLSGAWTFVASNRLPADFAKIPPGSARDNVLANVAGTIPAKEAVLDAQIPQTAEVDRMETTENVNYDGDPQFEPIASTDMSYAINTQTPVILLGGRYYACDRGIWFESYRSVGPWAVCVSVPPAIYTIPPRYPVYYVRYVRIYSYTPSTVYVGYTSGYTGCYVYHGTVVYGTGYHYHPWHRQYYYPRPWTWGFGIHYDPWTGWTMGFSSWWRPRGWFAGSRSGMRPAWWGPAEYRPVYRTAVGPVYREGYHPIYRPVRTQRTIGAPQSQPARAIGVSRTATLYDHWTSGVRRPVASNMTRPEVERRIAPSQQPVAPRPSPTTEVRPVPQAAERSIPRGEVQRAVRPETPIAPRVTTQQNNVYAAPDGNILRRTPQGGWQQRDQNTWKPAAEAPQRAVEPDYQARQRAAERSTSFAPRPAATPRPAAPPRPAVQAPERARPAPEQRKGR
ncbi:MAG TPA: hypothetical protein VL126_01020 [Bacteroidota bacterium]|nr:hypothetical protein [Bacteroidota bacterium]